MEKEHLRSYYEGISNQFTQTLKHVTEKSIHIEELIPLHEQILELFEHLQQSLHSLKPHYQFNEHTLTKIMIQLQHLQQKLMHQEIYPRTEILTFYKKTMQNVLAEFLGLSLTPRRAPSFLVQTWTTLLQFLEKISFFYIIRTWIAPEATKGSHRFVDYWLLTHSFLAIIYVFIAAVDFVPLSIKYIFLVYSCLRMFEILIYQLNVILVHPYNTKNYSLHSYRRMTIALLHNFFEIIFWFAGTFITLKFIAGSSVPLAIYTSFIHMVTYSMDLEQGEWSLTAIFILQFQAIIGVFMTVLSLARFVSLFPQPMSMDLAEQQANELRHDSIMKKLCELEIQVNKNKSSIQQMTRHNEENIEAPSPRPNENNRT